MLKKMVVSAVLATMLATPVVAKELVTNGGFEDGLTSWNLITEGGYTDAVWNVDDVEKTSGQYSGNTKWDYQVRQDLEPVKVSDIKSFKFNAKLAYTTNAVVVITYTPAEGRSKYSDYVYAIISPEDTEWNEYDILSILDPTKKLESIKLSGYSSSKVSSTWFDDVSIQTHDETAAPETLAAICPNVDEKIQTSYDQGIAEGLYQCEPEVITEYVDRPVTVVEYVNVPVEKVVYVDKVVTVQAPTPEPVIQYVEVEKVVTVTKEVPVEKIVYVDVPVEVEVPVEVVKTVFVDRPIEVPAEVVTVSICDSDFSSMSNKDQRQIEKYCGHVAQWEARITKLVNTGVDNNSNSNLYVSSK